MSYQYDECPHCGCGSTQEHHTGCPNYVQDGVKVVINVHGWLYAVDAYLHPAIYDMWLDRPALPILP